MPTEHVPVLASELIALTGPRPGRVAVDCTFGAGGHARLVAERLAPGGELITIDRDPTAEERFAGDSRTRPRARRASFAPTSPALAGLAAEGVRADLVYMDSGISSPSSRMGRGFSYSYDAPPDMRMDPDQELSALEVVNEWPERRIADAIRDYGEERHARRVAREIVSRRPLRTTSQLVEAIRAALPPEARFGRGHPRRNARSRESASPSTASSRRSTSRCPPRGSSCAPAGASPRSPSTRSRTGASSASSPRARPGAPAPEIPVCVCGRTPEAELLSRRAMLADARGGGGQSALAVGPPARRSSSRTKGSLMGAVAPARSADRAAQAEPSEPHDQPRPSPPAAPAARRRRAITPLRRVDPRSGRPRREPRRLRADAAAHPQPSLDRGSRRAARRDRDRERAQPQLHRDRRELAARSQAMSLENAKLRSDLTKKLSGPRIEAVAIANGLLTPEPREITYYTAGDHFAKIAARRIEQGLLTSGGAPVLRRGAHRAG